MYKILDKSVPSRYTTATKYKPGTDDRKDTRNPGYKRGTGDKKDTRIQTWIADKKYTRIRAWDR